MHHVAMTTALVFIAAATAQGADGRQQEDGLARSFYVDSCAERQTRR